jgi:hypothetical protein
MSAQNSPKTSYLIDLFDVDKKTFFIIMVLIFLFIRMLMNDIINESIPNYEELNNDGSLLIFQVFKLLNYIWTPFALLWKFTVISFLIWVMAFIYGYKVSYLRLWQIVMISESIFIFPELISFLKFSLFSTDLKTTEIQNYYPLSILSFLDTENIPKKFHYPFKTLNIFELLYAFLLAIGFKHISKRSFENSFYVIVFGYLLFLVLWLIFYIITYR